MGGPGDIVWLAGVWFTAVSAAFAVMLLRTGPAAKASRRDNDKEMRLRLRVRTALVAVLLLAVFLCGAGGLQRNKPLRVDFTGMQFDRHACAKDAECGGLPEKRLFVVGDDTTVADLVVRGRGYAVAEPHALVSVVDDGKVRVRIAPYDYGDGRLRSAGYSDGGQSGLVDAACQTFFHTRLCRTSPAAPKEIELKPGREMVVNVYDFRPIDASARERRMTWQARVMAFGRSWQSLDKTQVALRTFTLSLDKNGDRLALQLHDPERATAGTCAQPAMLLLQRPHPEDGGIAPGNLAFRFLGGRADAPYAPYSLSGDAYIVKTTETFCDSDWKPDLQRLDAEAADSPGFTFAFHKFEIPWCLFALAAASLIFVHAVSEGYWIANRTDSVVIGLVQYLIAVRALIGVRGVFLDTGTDLSGVCVDLALSLTCIPIVFMALRPVRRGDARTDILAAAGIAAVCAWLCWWANGIAFVYWAIPALAVSALAGRRVWAHPPIREAVTQWVTQIAASPGKLSPGSKIILLTLAVRVILLIVFNAKERLFDLPLSIPYLLGLIAGFTLLIDDGARRPGRLSGLWFVMLFMAAVIVAPQLLHDNGVALTTIVPFAAVAAWQIRRHNGSLARHRLWLLPLPAYVLMFGVILAYIFLHRPPDLCPIDTPDLDCMNGALRYAEAMNDRNLIRVMALFTPDDVPKIGTINAMESAQQVLHLRAYGGHFLGQGYLAGIDNWGNLRDVQFSDNLSAIHILYPFGRSGAIGLLLVMFCAVMALLRTPAEAAAGESWRRVMAQLALWTFFGTGAYMILANLLLVPFTGRNIYLLAVTSVGDIVEGVMLLALAYLTLSPREPQP